MPKASGFGALEEEDVVDVLNGIITERTVWGNVDSYSVNVVVSEEFMVMNQPHGCFYFVGNLLLPNPFKIILVPRSSVVIFLSNGMVSTSS